MHEFFRRLFGNTSPEPRRISMEEFDKLEASIPRKNIIRFESDETYRLSALAASQDVEIPEVIENIKKGQTALAQGLLNLGKVTNFEEGLERAKKLVVLNPNGTVTYTRDFLNVSYLEE